jgi:hypothetical protein
LDEGIIGIEREEEKKMSSTPPRKGTSKKEEVVSKKEVAVATAGTSNTRRATVQPTAYGLSEDKSFKFYRAWGEYTGVAADGLVRFASGLETVDPASVEFHLQRGDFEKWLTEVVKDPELATRLSRIRNYKGNEAKNIAARLARQRLQELNLTLGA